LRKTRKNEKICELVQVYIIVCIGSDVRVYKVRRGDTAVTRQTGQIEEDRRGEWREWPAMYTQTVPLTTQSKRKRKGAKSVRTPWREATWRIKKKRSKKEVKRERYKNTIAP